ncbi:MAG TPA: hypothetical protein VJX71_02560 [Methylomirabilota bacterium]|nr:hypothetical protein [Methylomirabilota bacterium]
MLNPGDKSPDFVGSDHNGQTVPPVDSTGRPSRFGVFYRIICAKDSFEVVPPLVEFRGVGIHDRHRWYIIPAG